MKTICLLAVPAVMLAANVCLWNYDPLDRFYDPVRAESINCSYWLNENLAALGHSVTVVGQLPADLSGYDLVFITMGFTRSC